MTFSVKARLFIFVVWIQAVEALLNPASAHAQNSSQIASRAREILNQHCYRCHEMNEAANRNVNLLNRARLVASGTVIPGDATCLLLNAPESGAIPPNDSKLPPSEIQRLREWMLNGASEFNASTGSFSNDSVSQTRLVTQSQASDSKSAFRTARTLFIKSESGFIQPNAIADALHKRSEFQRMGFVITRVSGDADLIITVNREPFTNHFTFSILDTTDNTIIGTGHVTSLFGTVPSKISDSFIKQAKKAGR